MRVRATTSVLAVVTGLGLALAGCGDDEDDGDGSSATPQPEGGMVSMDASMPRDGGAASTPTDDRDGAAPARRDTAPPPSTTCEPTGACDPFEDAGTCGDEACQLAASGLVCGAVDDGAGGDGEACTTARDCQRGLACMSLSGGTRCVRLCPLGSVGHCGDDASCSGTTSAACVGFCRALPAPCDIFAQDCEDPAHACTLAINEETDERYTGCMPAGDGNEGSTCANVADCGKGLICVANSCVRVCQSGDAGNLACTGGRSCTGTSQAWDIPYCR